MTDFRKRLKDHAILKGMLLTTPSCEIAEALSHTRLDWVFIDIEHSAMGFSEAQDIVRALGTRMAGIIRIPDDNASHVKKALDTGCDGIIVPQINSARQAANLVGLAKYAPMGSRSVGIARAHGHGPGFKAYMDRANDEIAIIAQIEHIDGVNDIEAIVSVAGIDAIFIGPFDLSASLGIPGQIDAPAVIDAIDRVYPAAKANGMPVGIFCPTMESAQSAIGKGATLVAVGLDVAHLVGVANRIADG
jgi:2-keto-3-deoxy-L-rhamnonate aldolase RhmA